MDVLRNSFSPNPPQLELEAGPTASREAFYLEPTDPMPYWYPRNIPPVHTIGIESERLMDDRLHSIDAAFVLPGVRRIACEIDGPVHRYYSIGEGGALVKKNHGGTIARNLLLRRDGYNVKSMPPEEVDRHVRGMKRYR